MFIATSWQFFS